MTRTIAFLGLGTMGKPMANHLLRAGFDLIVWNRTTAKCNELVERGALQAKTPAQAARNSDVLMYCLASNVAVEEVAFGDAGVLSGVHAGQTIIDLSTSPPELALYQAKAYGRKNANFLDAPVFGSVPEVNAGALIINVGGSRKVFEELQPVFAPFSASTHFMGENGKGAMMSLVGSLIVGLQMQALAEAMVFAVRGGLRPSAVLDVISRADFRSPLFAGMGAGIPHRDFAPMFKLEHLQKDVDGIDKLAKELNIPLPASAVVRETIKAAINQGAGEENASALVKGIEIQAGIEVADSALQTTPKR